MSAGFIADPGTQQTEGQLPQITSRLDELAKRLGITIYGISGYRTPSHSVAVGGFANDPHTQGAAEDIGVGGQTRASAGTLSNAELASVGLYRPFDMNGQNPTELNHIQLIPGSNVPGVGSSTTLPHTVQGPAGALAGAAGGVASTVGGAVVGGASSAANLVGGAGGDIGSVVTDAVSSAFSGFLSFIEQGLAKGALYFVLVVGGTALAGYGLVKALEPTGIPQTIRTGAEAAAA